MWQFHTSRVAFRVFNVNMGLSYCHVLITNDPTISVCTVSDVYKIRCSPRLADKEALTVNTGTE
uniref:Uncharacterized protein n=1 Tax=Anguilla anguilla TaxID=7936 RepID=A0A0E9QU25_ANGAN